MKTKKTKNDWSQVNWIDQDVVISKQLVCSRERVRQKRKELGKARSPYFHKIKYSILNDILALNTEDMTLEDISVQMKVSKAYVRGVLTEYNKKYIVVDRRKGGKYQWGRADWNKTDKEVALELGVKNPGVVTGHRRRLGVIKNRVKIVAEKEKTCWFTDKKVKSLTH